MAIIKLGNKTLGSISLGGAKLGNAKQFRTILRSKHIPVNVSPSIPPIVGPGGGDIDNQWLLQGGTWNDNGVWDDTQTWND